jgi:hypothetical protein
MAGCVEKRKKFRRRRRHPWPANRRRKCVEEDVLGVMKEGAGVRRRKEENLMACVCVFTFCTKGGRKGLDPFLTHKPMGLTHDPSKRALSPTVLVLSVC